jgi:hypothetical protein
VRVATGDINGDGIDEIITAPGRNYKPLIRIFSQDGTLLEEFLAYKSNFVGGVELAVADMNGDGFDDIITGMSYNGNEVRVFRSQGTFEFGNASTEAPRLTAFNPFGTFKGGVVLRVADMGNVENVNVPTPNTKILNNNVLDNRPEIIVGNGPGMRSTVLVFGFFPDLEPATITAPPPVKLRTFTPFSNTFRGGISLDVARINADQVPDIIASTGSGGGSKVQILNGLNGVNGVNGALITPEFSAFPKALFPSSYNTPLRITALDTDGDGDADQLLAYQGTDGKAGQIRLLNLDGTAVDQIFEAQFDSVINGMPINDFLNAYFVATLKKPSRP